MSRSILLLLVVATFIAFCGVSRGVAADPAAAKAAVTGLLEKGWERTGAARGVVNDCDLQSKELAGDSFVAAAHWLVLMHQNRYDDALGSLKTFFECKPTGGSALYGLRAKAWIQTVKKDYAGAMVTAESLAQSAGQGPMAASATVSAPQAGAIEFLGHLAGFLEGPAEKNADQGLRKKFEAVALAKFDEPRKVIFNEAKAEVLAEFQKFMADAAGTVEQGKADDEAEKQKKIAKLADDNAKLEKDAAKAEDKAKQLQEEMQKALAEIERRDAFMAQRLNVLQNSLTALSTQASQAQANATQLAGQAAREQNANARQQMEFNAQQARNTVGNFQTQMDNLRLQMTDVAAQRTALMQLKQQAMGGANVQDQLLQHQQKMLEKEKTRNENKQKRAEQTKGAASGKTLALEAKAHSFTSYDAFPLEELRETLLRNVR